MADPPSTVASIYKTFETEFTDGAKLAKRTYLANNPQKKTRRHRYSLEEFGLNANTIREQFADYRERYINATLTMQ